AERSDFLRDYVRQQVARVMGHEASQLDVQRGGFEIGMDSLMAVELRNRLESSTGRRLPATLIFNYPHIQALAGYLQRELLGGEMATTTVVNGDAREPAGLESVSEDELLALFDEELAA